MSRIVIKKRISLDFIGDEYSDCYLEFKTIPMKDYEQYVKLSKTESDESSAVEFLTSTLKKLFVGGNFKDDDGKLFDVRADELDDFDITTIVTCFKTLTGQAQSPN